MWFVDARARDAPDTSAVLEEKANHLAGLLGKPEFKASILGSPSVKRGKLSFI